MNPNSIKNGGPVYPVMEGDWHRSETPGLSIRDHFAGLAMQGFCTQPPDQFDNLTVVARQAYLLADAMLAARGEA